MAEFSKGGSAGMKNQLSQNCQGATPIFLGAKRSIISRYSWHRGPRVLQNQENGKHERETLRQKGRLMYEGGDEGY